MALKFFQEIHEYLSGLEFFQEIHELAFITYEEISNIPELIRFLAFRARTHNLNPNSRALCNAES